MKLRSLLASAALAAAALVSVGVGRAQGASEGYAIDPVHSSIIFRCLHLNTSYVYGRFNDFSGTFVVDDANPAACSVTMDVKAETVDTGTKKRDDHLRTADFLNVAQFPTIAFRSTAVKKTAAAGGKETYAVTGNLTLHGVTKSIDVVMSKIGTGKDPQGKQRMGLEGTIEIQRSDFGMTFMADMLGDTIRFTVTVEGVRQ